MKQSYSQIDKQLRTAGRIASLFMRPNKTSLRLLNRSLRAEVGTDIDGIDSSTCWVDRSDGSGTVRTRVFRPKTPQAALPIIIHLHGGGYAMGAPEQNLSYIKTLIDIRPCVIVAPDYRLALDDPYPAGFNDCYDTLLWAKTHAEDLNGRSDQIFVYGESAGAGLAIAMCLRARDEADVAIAFQMPLYPMIDDRQINPSAVNNKMPVWGSKHNKLGWQLYLRDLVAQGKPIPAYAAPSRADSFAGLPPIATFVGSLDPFRDETVHYIEALKAANVPVQFELFEGGYHGFEKVVPTADVSIAATRFMHDAFAHAVDNYTAAQPA